MWRIASVSHPSIQSLAELEQEQYEQCLKEVHVHLVKHKGLTGSDCLPGSGVQQ